MNTPDGIDPATDPGPVPEWYGEPAYTAPPVTPDPPAVFLAVAQTHNGGVRVQAFTDRENAQIVADGWASRGDRTTVVNKPVLERIPDNTL